jgi:hypothetical protein
MGVMNEGAIAVASRGIGGIGRGIGVSIGTIIGGQSTTTKPSACAGGAPTKTKNAKIAKRNEKRREKFDFILELLLDEFGLTK